MFIGCQFSLYPMTDRFVPVILDAVKVLHEKTGLRIETDDISTLLIGQPRTLFAALEACFLRASAQVEHLVLNVTFSYGCPGEPDDPLCDPENADLDHLPVSDLSQLAPSGVQIAGQFALYPLGNSEYMESIYREIALAEKGDLAVSRKHFCTRLDGDASQVFAYLLNAFERATASCKHVVITATLSKGSPTQERKDV